MSGIFPRSRWIWLLLVPLAAGLQRPPRPVPQTSKGEAVLTIQLQKSLAETKPVPFTPKRLVDAPPQPRATATNTAPWYTHLYANPLQNGRLAAPLRATSWRVRWSVALAAPPGAVLRADNRILVQGGGWQLLALDGKLVAQGTGGRSAASVDPTNALFYLINGSSYLEARFLNNGDLSFQSPLLTNERFAWPLIARSRRSLADGRR